MSRTLGLKRVATSSPVCMYVNRALKGLNMPEVVRPKNAGLALKNRSYFRSIWRGQKGGINLLYLLLNCYIVLGSIWKGYIFERQVILSQKSREKMLSPAIKSSDIAVLH